MKPWLLSAGLALGLAALLTSSPGHAQYPPRGGYGPAAGAEGMVRDWYRNFLRREPDPMAATWIDQLRSGQPPETVLAQILATSEYYLRGGSRPQGFIRRLFLDLTGRPPGAREMDFWVNQLYRADRQDVVYQLLQRYPQNWGAGSAEPPPEEPNYDYRRPFNRYYPNR